MAAIPFMPLYVADYLADAAHLSTVEHGAYLLLIMAYWQRGEALPDDDTKLARICRLGPREWKRIKPTISEFFEVGRSIWLHNRLESELANARAKLLKKREAGLARAKQMHSERSADAQHNKITLESIPLSNDNGDAEAQFWADAKTFLGRKSKNPGALVAKFLREQGKDLTMAALNAAQLERAVDPVEFCQGYFRKYGKAKTYDRDRITV